MPDTTPEVTPPPDKFNLVAWLFLQGKAIMWSLFVFGLGIFCGIGLVYKAKDKQVSPTSTSTDVRRLEVQVEKLAKEKQALERQVDELQKKQPTPPLAPDEPGPPGQSSFWTQPKTGVIILGR